MAGASKEICLGLYDEWNDLAWVGFRRGGLLEVALWLLLGVALFSCSTLFFAMVGARERLRRYGL